MGQPIDSPALFHFDMRDTILLTLSPELLLSLFATISALFLFAFVINNALNLSNSGGHLPVCLFFKDFCFFLPADFGVSEILLVLSEDCFWLSSSVPTEELELIPASMLSK